MPAKDVPFLCSWSGGKDSCLAFHRAVSVGARPVVLISMLREDGTSSRSHGLPAAVLHAQARSLGVPLILRSATWPDYEATFLDAVAEAKRMGACAGVFGDMDVEAHREWVVRTCGVAGVEPHLPLWKLPRDVVLREVVDLGYCARVVSCRADVPGPAFLGRTIDDTLVQEFDALGIDPAGENGEYHTVVVDGPRFSTPLTLDTGEITTHSDYCFLDVSLSS